VLKLVRCPRSLAATHHGFAFYVAAPVRSVRPRPEEARRRRISILRRILSCGILVSVSSVVSQDPEILGGEPVFTGTRVPVKSLFDHLEAGDSIEQFLEGFPSVKREQVIALLEEAREHALSAS
jgi:uncharacterized protein (DUF433 family)